MRVCVTRRSIRSRCRPVICLLRFGIRLPKHKKDTHSIAPQTIIIVRSASTRPFALKSINNLLCIHTHTHTHWRSARNTHDFIPESLAIAAARSRDDRKSARIIGLSRHRPVAVAVVRARARARAQQSTRIMANTFCHRARLRCPRPSGSGRQRSCNKTSFGARKAGARIKINVNTISPN